MMLLSSCVADDIANAPLQLPSFLAINVTSYNFWMTYILNYL